MTLSKRDETLKAVRDNVLALTNSPLYAFRIAEGNYPVIGEGSHSATIMFIGEAPGKNEAKTARPFCGAAGNILDGLLKSISIPRADVYITNIVKDRPPGNRDPLPEEIDLYAPFLDMQVNAIQPKVIVTLGRFSMQYIMNKFGLDAKLEPISTGHGTLHEANAPYGAIHILPLYHPAAAIYNRNLIPILEHDIKALLQFT